jgi:hypothetical protein
MNELKYNLKENFKYKNIEIGLVKKINLDDLKWLLKNSPKEFKYIELNEIVADKDILIKVFYLLCNMLKEIDYGVKILALDYLRNIIEL